VEHQGNPCERSPDDEPTLELPVLATGRIRMPRWPIVVTAAAAAGVLGLLIVRSGGTDPAPPVALPPGATWQIGPASPAPTTPVPAAPVPITPVPAAPAPAGHTEPTGRTGIGVPEETIAIAGGSAAITVRTADLDGGARYRVTPAGTAVTERGGTLRVAPGKGPVDVTLAAGVRWRLALDGTDRSSIDLRQVRLAAVDLSGGSAVNLTLPRPDGTLTVRTTGGVDQLGLRTADRVPVRVRVGTGAGRVVLDGATHSGVGAGAEFTSAGWDAAANRIDVDAAAGLAALTVAPY
jgi:hypothetical protein